MNDATETKPAEVCPLPAPSPDRPPVPWMVHMHMQSEFAKLVHAMGVTVKSGEPFADSVERCHTRARAASAKAEQYEAVLALLGTSAEVLGFAEKGPKIPAQARKDIEIARTTFSRALAILRNLAGKK